MESNDSPEIPDRGETSDIPSLPSGAGLRETFIQKYIVEKTFKAEIRPEEQREKAERNQLTVLRFQTKGRHQTSPASLRGTHRRSPLGQNIQLL